MPTHCGIHTARVWSGNCTCIGGGSCACARTAWCECALTFLPTLLHSLHAMAYCFTWLTLHNGCSRSETISSWKRLGVSPNSSPDVRAPRARLTTPRWFGWPRAQRRWQRRSRGVGHTMLHNSLACNAALAHPPRRCARLYLGSLLIGNEARRRIYRPRLRRFDQSGGGTPVITPPDSNLHTERHL